jgi:hypothetical protein
MDTKIPSSFWSDPAHDNLDAETLLAILWIKTNERLNLLGYAEISPRIFEFQTRKPFDVFTRACQALGKGLVSDGNHYWLRDFIGEQIGRGDSLVKNHMRKPLVRALALVPSPTVALAIKSEYPELIGESSEASSGRAYQAPEQSRAEQNREEQSRAEQRDGGVGEGKPRKTTKSGSTRPSEHLDPERSRMIAVADVMRRRADSLWSEAEKKALAAAGLLEATQEDFDEQVAAMKGFYRASIPPAKKHDFWRRTTLPILLNNWPSELDKARAWQRDAGGEGDGLRKVG